MKQLRRAARCRLHGCSSEATAGMASPYRRKPLPVRIGASCLARRDGVCRGPMACGPLRGGLVYGSYGGGPNMRWTGCSTGPEIVEASEDEYSHRARKPSRVSDWSRRITLGLHPLLSRVGLAGALVRLPERPDVRRWWLTDCSESVGASDRLGRIE